MSDLQCAASVLLARHAEAVHEAALTDEGGDLTDEGCRQATELGHSLRSRRIAVVYTSSRPRAARTAELAAAALGVRVEVRHDLREFGIGELAGRPFDAELFEPVFARWRRGELGVGCPGGESGSDVVRRVTAVLEGIADEHRGETVLVVSHSGAIQLAAPALVPGLGDTFAPSRRLDPCDVVELRADADGWQCTAWDGEER